MRHTFYGTRTATYRYASTPSDRARAAAAVDRADLAHNRVDSPVPAEFLL